LHAWRDLHRSAMSQDRARAPARRREVWRSSCVALTLTFVDLPRIARRSPAAQTTTCATGFVCSLLTPPFIDARSGLFAALLRECGVVRLSLIAAAVVGRWVVSVEGRTFAKSSRQVRIGYEL